MMSKEEKPGDPLINLIDIILSRKLIISIGFLSVFCIVLLGVTATPSTYEAYSKIYIAPLSLPRVELPYISEMKNTTFLMDQIELIKSRTIRLEVVKNISKDNFHKAFGNWYKLKAKLKNMIYPILRISIDIPDPTETAINFIMHSTRAELARGTNIVTIFAITDSAHLSALLANSMAETYINYANSLMLDKAESAYSYIEQEIDNARQKLLESERALNEFKMRVNAYSISRENSIITDKLAELDEMVSQESQASYKKLINLKDQKEALLIYQKNEHPDIKVLQNRITEIENKLIQEKSKNDNEQNEFSSTERNQIKTKNNYITEQIKKLKERLHEIAKIQVEMDQRTNEYLNNRDRLNALISRKEDAEILKAYEINQGPIKIIEKAVPPLEADLKKKKILLAVGTVAASIFGLGMAFVAEYLDDSLKTSDEAEKYLKLSVLGTVPELTRKMRNS